jgi:hypothetical protein
LESAAPPELSLLKLDAFWSRAAFRAAACLPVVPLVLAPFWAKRAAARFVRTAFFAALEAAFVTFSQRFGVRLPLTDRTGIVGALGRTFLDAGVARTRPDRLLPSIF